MARGRKKKSEATQDEAEQMIENGEAEIPAEEIDETPAVSESSNESLDYAKHPKFHKFKAQPKGAE